MFERLTTFEQFVILLVLIVCAGLIYMAWKIGEGDDDKP